MIEGNKEFYKLLSIATTTFKRGEMFVFLYSHNSFLRGDMVYHAEPCGSRTAPCLQGPWSHCVSCHHAKPPPEARARQCLGRLV